MKKTFLTSDWHLGEDRFNLMSRPFKTVDEHIETLIKNHNELVSTDDDVIMVGDVCYQNAPQYLPMISKFNGHKILIRGNHDRVFTDEQFKPYFNFIVGDGGGYYHQFGDINCYITHYPSEGKLDAFNLVGHVHSAWKYQLNSFNIGVDVNHFKPVDSDTIKFHLDAISKYYDEDVWVAYHAINNNYRGKRGKSGTYIKRLGENK